MTTYAETKTRKTDPSVGSRPDANDLMLKDLPRPEHRATADGQRQIFTGPGPSTTEYNAIDLGNAPTDAGNELRPVELIPEEPSSAVGTASTATDATENHPNGLPDRPSTDRPRRSDAEAGESSAVHGTTPPALQPPPMRPPRQSPSLKTPSAGVVARHSPETTASTANHTLPPSPQSTARRTAAKQRFWMKAAVFAGLTVLAALGVAYLVADPPRQGTINGVVVDARSGRVIAGATVDVDGRQAVLTNTAGFFSFADVKAGAYLIKASAPGYQPQAGTMRTEPNQTSQFSFTLTPLLADATAPASADTTKSASQRSDQTPVVTTTSGPVGSVDLRVTDVGDYLVFVDGEIYGKNAQVLKRLTTGEHRIVLQVDGYQDYSTVVTVKTRVTSTLTIAKSDLVPKSDPIKRGGGHFAEGKDYLERNLWPAAIAAFDLAVQSDPQNIDAIRYRGWAHLQSGNASAAAADFTQAAALYAATKQYMEAVTCTGYLIDLAKNDASLRRQRGGYYLALNDYKKAISDYEKAVKIDKKSAENQMALAEACYTSGDYRRAAKEFDRARKIAGNPTDAYVRMILSYYHAGDNEEVAKKYRDFAKMAPADALNRLKTDPDWLQVLQIVGPAERSRD